MKTVLPISIAISIMLIPALSRGQQPSGADRISTPRHMGREFDALGERLKKRRQERLVLTGTLTIGRQAPRPVRIIHEAPSSFRLAPVSGSGPEVVYDGRTASSANSADADAKALLGSLRDDWPDNLFLALTTGRANLRLLGRRFRPEGTDRETYKGLTVDLYSVYIPSTDSAKTGLVNKLIYFDSATGLLQRVRTDDASLGSQIDTLFQNWQLIGGSLLPSQIERIQGGTVVLSLDIVSAAPAPNADDGAFETLSRAF